MSADSSRTRRSFSEEFKRDAVNLIVKQGFSFASAAKAVGVGERSLRLWHRKFAPQAEPAADDAAMAALRAESQRLRRELQQVERECEILRKAAADFSKQSQ